MKKVFDFNNYRGPQSNIILVFLFCYDAYDNFYDRRAWFYGDFNAVKVCNTPYFVLPNHGLQKVHEP